LRYDAVVIGAGISGSVSAKILAENGCNVLLVDRATPPRDKACSGVQLRYMEKLIGEKIPRGVLCGNTLNRVRLTTPSGRHIEGGMPLLNYWRRDFDHWLNGLAADAGADTRWGAEVTGLDHKDSSVTVTMDSETIEAEYIIGADGLSPGSFTRRQLLPDGFSENVTGASLNLYIEGMSSVRSDTLYLYYRRGLSDLMYSWLYYKDNLLVIGTSSTERLSHYADAFRETVEMRFDLRGKEAGREGYSTHCKGGVFLGRDRVLLVGDAAGLLDLYRGVGMDAAALSGRLAALSIMDALEGKEAALVRYKHRTRRLVSMIEENARKQEARYASDEALEDSLSPGNIIKGRVDMFWAQILNRLRKPEEMRLLPP
jgi:flavin-dependent dehydrogenase